MNPHDAPSEFTAASPQADVVGRLVRLIFKELKEILRDRRTILTLLLMPVLLYPLLSIAFQQLLLAGNTTSNKKEPNLRLGFIAKEKESAAIVQTFADTVNPALLREREAFFGLPPIPLPELEIESERVRWGEPEKLQEVLRNRQLDLVFRLLKKGHVDGGKGTHFHWEVHYLKDSPRSLKALRQVQERLAAMNTGMLLTVPVEPGLPRVVSQIEPKAVMSDEKKEAFPLKGLVPLILILMTITGAVYPAIDLTAGERERGTLEVLVAAPVPRLGLLFAKYVSVLTVALLTALINLTMMMLTIWVNGLNQQLFGDNGLTPLVILEIFGLLVLFAAFFSAVLLTLTSFARSFKEAQAYLIPLMLVSLAPGVAGMLPALELSAALCMVPLLNIVLLGRAILGQEPVLAMHVVLVIGSTLIYATAALALAARIFGAENVLYNEQASWRDLFRRPAHVQEAATLTNALICLCFIFFLSFMAQGLAREFAGPNATVEQRQAHFVIFGLFGALLFAGLPLLSAKLRRIRFASGFMFHKPAPLSFAGAMMLGLSLWPFALELLALLQQMGWTLLTPELKQQIRQQAGNVFQTMSISLVIVAVQALVEELFFRGFLFAALRKITNARATIVVSALLFGVAHMTTGPLGVDRFLPSLLMGLVLGWVCWRSQSVVPGMVLHAAYNIMLVVGGRVLVPMMTGDPDVNHVPWPLLLAGGVGVCAGGLLLWLRQSKQ